MAADSKTWQSGGGRRIVLAFAFLLLLPFYASLGPMLWQRLSRSFVGDTVSLLLLAIAFTALMALILQQLVHAVRTRISLTDTAVEATVPKVGKRGPLFFLGYETKTIPFGDIAGIDKRNEVYGGSLLPVLLTSTRLVTKSGPPLVLGYENTNDHEPQLPFGEIGSEIARRANVPVTDHGTVRRSLARRVAGVAATADENTALPAAEIEQINNAHRRNVRSLVAALAALVLGGIAMDFATASRTTFAEMGAGLANPAKGAAPAAGPAAPTAKKK